MFNLYGDEEEEQVALLSERIMFGMESRFSRDIVGKSLGFTTAAGQFGTRLMKEALKNRSAEEKVVDRLSLVAREIGIDDNTKNSVIRLIPKIPDPEYKSAIGLLLGYLAKDFINPPISDTDKNKLKYIFDKAEAADKKFKITPLDVIRYARLYNLRVLV